MNADDCRSLMAHAEWADALVWRAVRRLQQVDTELQEKLHHLHLVQWAYLQVWRGDPMTFRDLRSFPSAESLQAWAREYYREAAPWLAGVPDAHMAEDVRFPWADRLVERFGAARPTTFADSVQQIAMHSAYHRGQVARRLRELGIEPPLTDFIAWAWLGRPAACWDDEAG